MTRLAIAALLGAVLSAPVRGDEPWLARAFVPSSNSVHGEIRLLKRGDTACMQTLLYSKYLRRGLHEMAKQERQAWPDNWPCCEVSSNYLADLAAVKEEVLGAAAGATNEASAPSRMLIEFCFSPTGTCFAVGDMDLEGSPEALAVVNARLARMREAHPYYVSRAMRMMGERGFGLPPDELDALLEKAGWQPVAAPDEPPAQRFVPR